VVSPCCCPSLRILPSPHCVHVLCCRWPGVCTRAGAPPLSLKLFATNKAKSKDLSVRWAQHAFCDAPIQMLAAQVNMDNGMAVLVQAPAGDALWHLSQACAPLSHPTSVGRKHPAKRRKQAGKYQARASPPKSGKGARAPSLPLDDVPRRPSSAAAMPPASCAAPTPALRPFPPSEKPPAQRAHAPQHNVFRGDPVGASVGPARYSAGKDVRPLSQSSEAGCVPGQAARATVLQEATGEQDAAVTAAQKHQAAAAASLSAGPAVSLSAGHAPESQAQAQPHQAGTAVVEVEAERIAELEQQNKELRQRVRVMLTSLSGRPCHLCVTPQHCTPCLRHRLQCGRQ